MSGWYKYTGHIIIVSMVILSTMASMLVINTDNARAMSLPYQITTIWHYGDGWNENVTIRFDNLASNYSDSLDAEDPPAGPSQNSDAYIETNFSSPKNELLREARPWYSHVTFHTGVSKWVGTSPVWVNVTWDNESVKNALGDNEFLTLRIEGHTTLDMKIQGWYNYTQNAFNLTHFWFEYSMNNPPNKPSNPSPSDGATGVSRTGTTLSWSCSDPEGDSLTYDVYFGTTTSPPKVSSNQSGTTYNPGTLAPSTTYYWKVVAWDAHSSNSSDLWSFTTASNQPPNVPSNPTPSNGATGVGINQDLSWSCSDPEGDSLTYDVYFGTTTSPPKVSSNQSGTTYDPGTMSYSTTYYWRIVAWDSYGASASSSSWSFTTESAPTNHPPNAPSNPTPSDGATGVSRTGTTLSWSCSDPDGEALTYDVYFGASPTPPMVSNNQSSNTYDPGTLSYSTTYYWKIVAWDSHGASNSSPTWSFTTESAPTNHPPNQPSNPSPSDGATGVGINQDLSWFCSDPDGDTITYDVYFGTSATPSKVSSNQSGTTYDPGTMSYSTTYYWKIVAWDSHGASNSSPTWSFTTQSSGTPSNNPPVAQFTYTTSDKNATFDASSSYDSDGSITNYTWSFGDGQYGYGINVNHTYSSDGTYTVVLTVKDDDNATDTESKTIHIGKIPPVARFSYVVENFTIIFTDESVDPDGGNIVSWSWVFGDGSTCNQENPTHTYQNDGTYMVYLTVTDDENQTNTTSEVIRLSENEPQVEITSITSPNLLYRGAVWINGTKNGDAYIRIVRWITKDIDIPVLDWTKANEKDDNNWYVLINTFTWQDGEYTVYAKANLYGHESEIDSKDFRIGEMPEYTIVENRDIADYLIQYLPYILTAIITIVGVSLIIKKPK